GRGGRVPRGRADRAPEPERNGARGQAARRAPAGARRAGDLLGVPGQAPPLRRRDPAGHHDLLTATPSQPWWSAATLYQIYPRSWADSNGDGIGDLPGVISRLEYLEWLGVDGIWFSPTMPSPNVDWGYDVSDYCDVHPALGTLDDLDRLVREAD